MVKLKDITEKKSIVELDNVHPTIVNGVRRAILNDVPTFAIEDVEVVVNESPLYNETVAQRIGLVPIVTDLESYKEKSKCSCNGVGCAMCEVSMTLKQDTDGYVYSGLIKSDDPKIMPADEKIPITKLFGGKKIELNLKAILGTGSEHMKWAPAHAYLRELDGDQTKIELVIEPFGQLDSKTIYNKAIDVLSEKLDILEGNF